MTSDQTPIKPDPKKPEPPKLPDSDPNNPFDLILLGGPHTNQSMRLESHREVLLLSTNTDGTSSAPFFAEYRATDHFHPLYDLRIYRYVGTGIDASSTSRPAAYPIRPALAPHIHKDHHHD